MGSDTRETECQYAIEAELKATYMSASHHFFSQKSLARLEIDIQEKAEQRIIFAEA